MSRTRWTLLGACLAVLGVDRSFREHDETDYQPFVKHRPSLDWIFTNPARCGECDLRPWDAISAADRERLAHYCRVRLGVDDVLACHRKMAAERL